MQSENASKKRLATVIREEMAHAGLSITELADKTGLKRPYLSLRLNGHRGFNADDLDRIGRVLDVPGWELMYRARGREATASSVGAPARRASRHLGCRAGNQDRVVCPLLRRRSQRTVPGPRAWSDSANLHLSQG